MTMEESAKRQLLGEAKIHLTNAAADVFQACQKLDKCNPRRFDQTVFRKDLVSIERKLAKMKVQLDQLDL